MLIVVTVVALFFGLFTTPALRQYWAVQQIQASGGEIYKLSEVKKGEGEVVKIDHWSWHLYHDVTLVRANINEDTYIDWRALPKLRMCEISSEIRVKSIFPKKLNEILKNQLPSKFEGIGIDANQDEDVTDETLSYLTRFPNLTHFSANLSQITDKGFQNLAQLKKLKFLRIGRGLQVKEPINLNIMNEWPDLEEFSLRLIEGNVTWDKIRFRDFSKLKDFELAFSGFSNDAMIRISEMPACERLMLEFNDEKLADQPIDEGIAAVAKMPKLNHLAIDGNTRMNAAGFTALAQSKSVTKLWLNCQYDPADLKQLATMPQLEEIYFNRHHQTPTDDQFVDHLVALKSLKRLDCSHSKLTDAGLKKLTSLENLEVLDISGTKITPAAIESLKKFKKLKSLELGSTLLWSSVPGMTQLQKELPNVEISN